MRQEVFKYRWLVEHAVNLRASGVMHGGVFGERGMHSYSVPAAHAPGVEQERPIYLPSLIAAWSHMGRSTRTKNNNRITIEVDVVDSSPARDSFAHIYWPEARERELANFEAKSTCHEMLLNCRNVEILCAVRMKSRAGGGRRGRGLPVTTACPQGS